MLRDADPVLHAVHGVFAALEWEEGEVRRTGQQPDTRQSVVSPNQLREALSRLPGQLFRVGEWTLGLGGRQAACVHASVSQLCAQCCVVVLLLGTPA